MTDQQQLALVTGASRGIGAATAEALSIAGYHVVLTARTSAGLEAVEERIHTAGGSATIAPADLTADGNIARLAEAIAERWQALDVMVLNAAMLGSLSPVPHIDPIEFAKVLTLNVTAQAALIGAFDPMLRASKNAKIVGLSCGKNGHPRAYWGAFEASKRAFEALLNAYGEEMRNIGRIRVAMVDPGPTRTAMRARAYPGEDPASVKPPEVVADRIVALINSPFETGHYESVHHDD